MRKKHATNNSVLGDIMMLASIKPRTKTWRKTWRESTREAVVAYCRQRILSASDHPVHVPPMPKSIGEISYRPR